MNCYLFGPLIVDDCSRPTAIHMYTTVSQLVTQLSKTFQTPTHLASPFFGPRSGFPRLPAIYPIPVRPKVIAPRGCTIRLETVTIDSSAVPVPVPPADEIVQPSCMHSGQRIA